MNKPLAILVIDDNEEDRMLCQRSLKSALGDSLLFMEAGNGESGLEAIEKHTPGCILLDYSLPGRNGIEVLKRIRAKHPYLPVIMLTGQGNEAIAVESMKEGAQDYIVKSAITPEALQRVVRVAIEHSGLQKRIDEQRASLEIFTHALAHDLKEPVRTIRSFVDLITDVDHLSEKSQRFFQFIRKAADRMNALIDTIYLYTRLDGAEQMEKISCDLTGVVKEVQDNLAQLMNERSPVITCDALPLVQTNHVQMIQLFQNLITNAIKHCDTVVTINVSASERDDHWQLSVRDNGPGIAAEYCAKIFDPFKRLSHRKEDGPGLGLGLAINRKIVESHGGKIWCESVLGTGTSFLFTLPKATAIAAPESVVSIPALSLNTKPADATRALARILLVDDNESDIELARIMLIEDGKLRCDFLTARDGKEALAILQDAMKENNPIDLVLLDINMPGMSGFELMMHMSKEAVPLNPLMVMCSTSAYDKDKRMAETLGAEDYLTKPPQFSHLKDIIDQCAKLQLYQEGNDYVLRRAA